MTGRPAAGAGGWATYDELGGPELDAARWTPARLPLPTGDVHVPLDPGAALAVGDGELRVTIPRFSLSHGTFQSVDSVKHLLLSTRAFELPADGPATFAAELAVQNLDGEPADYRRGIAAFQVADLEGTKRVLSVGGTSTRVFALDEHLDLRGDAASEPYVHVIESPYADFDDDVTRFRACEITLDRSASSAVWRVDGRTVYHAQGTVIPARARIALGIFTMLPVRAGRSRSLAGQGIDARWRRCRVRGVGAAP